MVSKKYQESATDFVQFDNKFTKLKLELVESHLKKEKERNERLQMHLAFAVRTLWSNLFNFLHVIYR